MLSTFLIWPSKRVEKLKINTPQNLYIAYRDKGSWIDDNMFEGYCRKNEPENIQGILLLDSHMAHSNKQVIEILKPLGIDVIYLPTNCTSII